MFSQIHNYGERRRIVSECLGSSVVEQAAVNRLVVGSNPSQDAKWPVHLSVRIPGFQPVKTSSTLVRATINCGVEEMVSLTGLITQRSPVRVRPPQLYCNAGATLVS